MFKKGDRIRHPKMPEWGLGEVLEDSCGEKVKAFFVDAGSKVLGLSYVTPELVSGEAAQSVFLDNLISDSDSVKTKHQSLPDAVSRFRSIFPMGFYDDSYLEQERDYKVKAHELMLELLDQQQMQQLIDAKNYGELCKRALKVANSTNLIFPNEKMALRDGLVDEHHQAIFSESLFRLLYSNEDLQPKLEAYIAVLNKIGASKWPVLTYFPFIRYPKDHIFLKPTVTQNAASILRFELNYRPELNWITYKCLLTLANEIGSRISALEPRDMIDVQSFIWCIDPNTY